MRRFRLLLPSFRVGVVLVVVGLAAVLIAAVAGHRPLASAALWTITFGLAVMVGGWIASGLRLRSMHRRTEQPGTA